MMKDIERKSREKIKNIDNCSLIVGESTVDADSVILEIKDKHSNSKNIMSDNLAKLLRMKGVYDVWAESDKIYVQVMKDFYN